MENVVNYRKLAANQENSCGQQITGLFRSGLLTFATESDLEFISDAGITNILDLRSQVEIERNRIMLPEITTNIDITGNGEQNMVANFSQKDLGHFMLNLYHNQFVASDGFKQCLDYLIAARGPVLFHCTAGKDRTGILGIILMYIFDFSYEQMISEYLILDQRIVDRLNRELAEKGIEQTIPYAAVEFVTAFLDGVKDKYGSIEYYLEHVLDLNDQKIEILKTKYLTDSYK